jgi:signal transduction histidine kinase
VPPDHSIAKQRVRRFYYTGAALLIILTVGSLVLPTYLRMRAELSTKIDQLAESIIDQKKVFLEAVIVEKISDIERTRSRLEALIPPLGAEELDRRFRAEVRELIHATELPDDGYIWINEIIDYSGGDDYAIRFAHPNLVDTEGDYLSTNATDIVGNPPYQEELEGVRQDGEIYFDYYFQKMGSELMSHKLTFAKLYEPYNWVVATGVYLDDVDALIASETERMVASTERTLRTIVIAIVIGSTVLLILTVLFETRIRQLIDSYVATERSINAELRDEKSKLEEVNRQKDRLFSVIAHDLTNPMTSIGILSDYLRSTVDGTGTSPISAKELSDALGTSVDSIQALLEDLLTWARTQSGVIEYAPVTTPASDHVQPAVDACSPVAKAKGVRLSTEILSSPVLSADPNMLGTVLRNLITNAIKFTSSGGSVVVVVEEADGRVLFRVRDTGIGMTEERQSTLFSIEHVHSAAGTDDERGTAFGLILCKEFVDRHGGTIDVVSQPGRGSEFTVTLPLER